MIAILIVTHGNLGRELLNSAELIIGRIDNIKALSFCSGNSVEDLHFKVKRALKDLDGGSGVLVFTDLYGGSPSNVIAACINDYKCECISGVNLPMLIEAIDSRENYSLEELTNKTLQGGIDGICNLRDGLEL